MIKPQVIGIGLNGLVGSRIAELLKDQIEFIPLGRSTGLDITNPQTLKVFHDYPNADFVLNLAAKADVDGCEKDKELEELGDAWKMNVQGAENVANASLEAGKKLIYISTDFVFDGEKAEGDSYSEQDPPNPINWYGVTKHEGEKRVQESGVDHIILRLAYPFRAKFEQKEDFVRFIKGRLEKGVEIKIVSDQIFCPTFLDDFAQAVGILTEKDASGIFHAVGGDSITPYATSLVIAETFGLDKSLIAKTTREEFFKDRAPRPFNLSLSNDKIKELGVKMRGFEESLQSVKSQLQ